MSDVINCNCGNVNKVVGGCFSFDSAPTSAPELPPQEDNPLLRREHSGEMPTDRPLCRTTQRLFEVQSRDNSEATVDTELPHSLTALLNFADSIMKISFPKEIFRNTIF